MAAVDTALPSGRWTSPGYRSGRTRATWSKALFGVTALTCVYETAIAGAGYDLADRVARGVSYSQTEVERWVADADTADSLFLVSAMALAVAFIAWLSRSVENVPPLGGGTPYDSPRWAIGWWFVPLAFLWKPYTVVRDVHDRLATASHFSGGGIVVAWWLTWILGGLGERFARAMVNSPTATVESVRGSLGLFALTGACLAASACLGFLVVREIQERANQRAVELALDAPEGRWPAASSPAVATTSPTSATRISPASGRASAPQRLFCPWCGAPWVANARFCQRCGSDLPAATAPASSQELGHWLVREAPSGRLTVGTQVGLAAGRNGLAIVADDGTRVTLHYGWFHIEQVDEQFVRLRDPAGVTAVLDWCHGPRATALTPALAESERERHPETLAASGAPEE